MIPFSSEWLTKIQGLAGYSSGEGGVELIMISYSFYVFLVIITCAFLSIGENEITRSCFSAWFPAPNLF